jgi:hypothetical protein
MAKVTGPLFSLTASGKLANAMVHFSWKGINCVRSWVVPLNKKSEDQGDIRTILAGLGRASRVIEKTSPYHVDAVKVAGPQQSFVSALVGFIMNNIMKDGTQFDTEYTEYSTHTAKTNFNTSAATLGLADFSLPYSGTTNVFTAGMQLYELAKYGCLRKNAVENAFNRAPYTTALASWTSAEVALLVTDLAAV